MAVDLSSWVASSGVPNAFGSDPFALSNQAALSPQIPPDLGPGEVNRGFIGSLIHETVADVKGAVRLTEALGSEAVNALGVWDFLDMAMPIGFEDLTKRDYTGAVMVGAMVAGGFLAKAARSIPSIAKMAQGSRYGAAGVDASVEFLTGLTYGTLRPLDEDESRVKTAFGDAALFGAFGAGFHVAKAAWRVSFGKAWGGARAWTVRRSAIRAAESLRDEQIIFELAGVRLTDPVSGMGVNIHRASGNLEKIEMVFLDAHGSRLKGKGATQRMDTFDEALSEAFNQGFIENMGVARPKIPVPRTALKGKADVLTEVTKEVQAKTAKPGRVRGTFRERIEQQSHALPCSSFTYQNNIPS